MPVKQNTFLVERYRRGVEMLRKDARRIYTLIREVPYAFFCIVFYNKKAHRSLFCIYKFLMENKAQPSSAYTSVSGNRILVLSGREHCYRTRRKDSSLALSEWGWLKTGQRAS